MLNCLTQYLNLTSSIVGVATVVFIVQLILKWQSGPRFTVGVLPSEEERKAEGIAALGKSSHFDEYVFDKRYFAKELHSESETAALKFDNDSSRNVYRDAAGYIRLPMIIQNNGKSGTKEYSLVLFFTEPEIRIADFKSETLKVEMLYTRDELYIEDKGLLEKIPAEEIRAIYKDINLMTDYLGLKCGLPGGTTEAMYLKLYVPKECSEFSMMFKIDCPDFFHYQRQVNGQHINVIDEKESIGQAAGI
jgi:hypothetical protein